MNIYILDVAQQDLIDGFRFYEAQREGLGDYFLNSLFADIESVRLYEGIHPVHFSYYRLLAKRFPFAVYYKTKEDNVYIYAVLDCRRNPAWVRNRLT